jgi:glycyl-tRNA synthetase beta chain
VLDFDRRVRAVDHFRRLPEAAALAAAQKRVANILAKSQADATPTDVNRALLQEPAEQALFEALVAKRAETSPLLTQRDYTAVLSALAALRAPVDAFFDAVLVNAEDPALRANRLALLAQLRALFWEVADIAQLPAAK